MPSILRNILAVIAGFLVGGLLNMAIVMLGPALIPPPAGVDPSDPESLARAIHLFEPRHFLAPWLAHALGTFAGALVAWLVATTRRDAMAWIVGGLFLCGGIAASLMIPAPAWFIAADLVLAYLPMAWLATRTGRAVRGGRAPHQGQAA